MFSLLDGGRTLPDELLVQSLIQAVILSNCTMDRYLRVRLFSWSEYRGKVQTVCLPVFNGPVRDQRVNPSQHIVDPFKAQLGHVLSCLFGDHEQVVHNMFRLSLELLPQARILGGDSNRASIEMTLAHHDATEAYQGGRGETKLLGSQKGPDHDIPARFESTIRLQNDPRTKIV